MRGGSEMSANLERVFEVTRERIAASQEETVRVLVRTNAMLEDEIEMLKAEVNRLMALLYGQNGCDGLACEGCRWWNDWDLLDLSPRCDNDDAPEPWKSAAMNGGLDGCPKREEFRLGQ
jgi:hypothetical protein